MRHLCGNIPLLLVGNKKDLRDKSENIHSVQIATASSIDSKCTSNLSSNAENIQNEIIKSVTEDSKLVHHTDDSSSSDAHNAKTQVTSGKSADTSRNQSVSSVSRLSSCESTLPQCIVSYEQGLAVARKMDAYSYHESSAKSGEGTEKLFETVVKAGMEGRYKKSTGTFRYKNRL